MAALTEQVEEMSKALRNLGMIGRKETEETRHHHALNYGGKSLIFEKKDVGMLLKENGRTKDARMPVLVVKPEKIRHFNGKPGKDLDRLAKLFSAIDLENEDAYYRGLAILSKAYFCNATNKHIKEFEKALNGPLKKYRFKRVNWMAMRDRPPNFLQNRYRLLGMYQIIEAMAKQRGATFINPIK